MPRAPAELSLGAPGSQTGHRARCAGRLVLLGGPDHCDAIEQRRHTCGHYLGGLLGGLLEGALIVETIFAWPGLGRLAFEAISQRD